MTQTDNSVLIKLFAHNTWANLKLLDYCETLTDAQLDATAVGTYGTIRDTLLHLITAEVSYVHRVNDKFPARDIRGPEFPSFDVLKDTVRWSGEELLALAQSAQADTLVEERSEEDKVKVEYPLASLIVQEINHSSDHRTQISTILTQLGLEPPDMTGWGYMEYTGEFKESKLP